MKERKEMRLAETGLGRLGAFARNFSRKKMTKRITAGVLALSMVFTSVGIDAWAVSESDAGTYVNSEISGTEPEFEEIQQGETLITVVGPEEEVSYEDGLCIHHPTHTEDCGYDPGSPCKYEEALKEGQGAEGEILEVISGTVTEDAANEADDITAADPTETPAGAAISDPTEEPDEVLAAAPTEAPTESTAEETTAAEDETTVAGTETAEEETTEEETTASVTADSTEEETAGTETSAADLTETSAETITEETAETETEVQATEPTEVPAESTAEETSEAEPETSQIVIDNEPVAMGWFDEGPGIFDEYYGQTETTAAETSAAETEEETTAVETSAVETKEETTVAETTAAETGEATTAAEPTETETIAAQKETTAAATTEESREEPGDVRTASDNNSDPEEEPAVHIHNEECGYRPAHKCEFVCPICDVDNEMFRDSLDSAVEFTFPANIESGEVFAGQEISLLDGVTAKKKNADDNGPSFEGMEINYNVEVYTVASDVSEPEEWNQSKNTLTPQEGSLYHVVYVAKDMNNNITAAIDREIAPTATIGTEVRLTSQLQGYIYANDEYPIESYVTPDHTTILYNGETLPVSVKVSVEGQSGYDDTNGSLVGTTDDNKTALLPTTDHVQWSPYTVTFTPYVNVGGHEETLEEALTIQLDVVDPSTIQDELKSDATRISALVMGDDCDVDDATGYISGTEPFDTDDPYNQAGNDHDGTNDIVRTYDTITYQTALKVDMQPDAYDKGYKQGRVYFEYFIPDVDKTQVDIVTDEMSWLHSDQMVAVHNGVEEFDGSKKDAGQPKGVAFRGSFILKGNGESPVGNIELSLGLVVRVLNMENGSSIAPQFTYWMAYNDVGIGDIDYDGDGKIPTTAPLVTKLNHECTKHGEIEYKTKTAGEIKVSAAPAYDVMLEIPSNFNTREGEYNIENLKFNKGTFAKNDTVKGRLAGYGIGIKLQQSKAGKGMRGVALPGPNTTIKFDLKISSSWGTSIDLTGDNSTANSNYAYKPLLYTMSENENITSTKEGLGALPSDVRGYITAMPFNKKKTTNGKNKGTGCFNGGTWNFEQDENDPLLVHVTVSGINIDTDAFPWTQTDSSNINKYYNRKDYESNHRWWDINEAFLSTGQLWVILPYYSSDGKYIAGESATASDSVSVYMKMEHVGGQVTVNNGEPLSDTITSDDSVDFSRTLVLPGSIRSYIAYRKASHSNWNDALTDGQWNTNGDYVVKKVGDKVQVHSYMDHQGDGEYTGVAYDYMVKFDDQFMEYDSYEKTYFVNNYVNSKVLYGTYKKTENGGWHDEADTLFNDPSADGYDDNLLNAMPEDLYWTTTPPSQWNQADTPEHFKGKYCVAVMGEFHGINIHSIHQIGISVTGKLKESAKEGEVYTTSQAFYVWTKNTIQDKVLAYVHTLEGREEDDVNKLTDDDYNAFVQNDSLFHTWEDGDPGYPTLIGGKPTDLPPIYFLGSHRPDDYEGMVVRTAEKHEQNNTSKGFILKKSDGTFVLNKSDYNGTSYIHNEAAITGYVKAKYDADGNYSPGSNSYYGGDSCLVLGHTDSVDITFNKENFDLDHNQRYLEVKVTPQISMAQEMQAGNDSRFEVKNAKLQIFIPEHINYLDGSAVLGGTLDSMEALNPGKYENPVISWTRNESGEWIDSSGQFTLTVETKTIKVNDKNQQFTVLTYTAKDVSVQVQNGKSTILDNTFLPINFTCLIGDPVQSENDVKNGDGFSIAAEISDEITPVKADGSSRAQKGLKVIKNTANGIFKTADQKAVEAGDPMSFTMSVQNASDGTSITKFVLDELPFDGDKRRSSFSGPLYVLQFYAGGMSSDILNNIEFYYTTKEEFKNKSTSGIAGGNDYNPADHSDDWTKMDKSPSFEKKELGGYEANWYSISLPEKTDDIVAIAAYGSIGPKSTLLMNVTVQAPNAQPGDSIVNGMSMDQDNAKSASGYSAVARREISGLTWFDADHDGVQDTGEPMLPGVKVTLIKTQELQTVDGQEKFVPLETAQEIATIVSGENNNVYDIKAAKTSESNAWSTDEKLGAAGYKFINAEPGVYTVRFESTDNVKLEEYVVTAKNISSAISLADSDATGIYGAEDALLKSAEISGITLESAKTGTTFQKNHMDAGFHGVDIEITKKVERDEWIPEAKIADKEFTFTVGGDNVKFTGPAAWYQVQMPQFVRVKANGTVSIKNLPVNKTVTITETGTWIEGLEVDTTYTVDGGEKAQGSAAVTTPKYNDADALVEVEFTNSYRAPRITIKKTQKRAGEAVEGSAEPPLTVTEDDQVIYYLTVENTGNATAKNVTVTDVIPQKAIRKTSEGEEEVDNGHPLTLAKDAAGNYIVNGGDYTYNDSTKTITWNLGDMEPKSSKTVSFQVTVPDVAAETHWKNVGKVTYDNPPEEPEPSNEVEIKEFAPKIEITKEQQRSDGDRTAIELGAGKDDIITYYLTVKNTGEETAKDVVVTDVVPQKAEQTRVVDGEEITNIVDLPLTLVENSIQAVRFDAEGLANKYTTFRHSYNESTKTITWELDDIAVGEAVEVSFKVSVPDVDTVTHWTNAGAAKYGNNPAGPDEEIPTNEVKIVEYAPHIVIKKSQSISADDGATWSEKFSGEEAQPVDAGYQVQYFLTITSDGSEPAKDVVVTDVIPQQALINGKLVDLPLTLVENSIQAVRLDAEGKANKYTVFRHSYDKDTKTITWKLGDISNGEAVEVSFKVSVPDVKEKAEWTNIGKTHYSNNPSGEDKEIESNEVKIEEEAPEIQAVKTQEISGNGNRLGHEDEVPTVEAGTQVTYYITVTETSGKSDAHNVMVKDTVPKAKYKDGTEVKLILDSIDNGGKLQDDGETIVWTIPEIEKNGTAEVSFKVTVPDASEDIVWENIAYVAHDPDPEDPEDPWEPTPEVEIKEGYPDVRIEKTQSSKRHATASKDEFRVYGDDEVTYYLRVTNVGTETAKSVTVSDVIPQTAVQYDKDGNEIDNAAALPLSFVEGSIQASRDGWGTGSLMMMGGYSEEDHEVRLTFAEIPPQKSIVVSFRVTVPEGVGIYKWTNAGRAQFGNDPNKDPEDPWTPSNEVKVEEKTPKLTQEKTQSLNGGSPTTGTLTVMNGDKITYHINVTNTSDADAENVSVYDVIPEGDPRLTLVDGSITDGGRLLEDDETILWKISRIAAKETKTVSFTVLVPDVSKDTKWTNTAYVHPGDPDKPDPDPKDPEEPWEPTNTVEDEEFYPIVSLVKEQSSNRHERTRDTFRVYGNDIVTYYLVVKNEGTEVAEDVKVTDKIPQLTVKGDKIPLELVPGSISEGGSLGRDGVTIEWTVGDLKQDESRELSFQVRVPEIIGVQNWQNLATATYENPPVDPEHPDDPPKGTPENPIETPQVEIYEATPQLTQEKTQAINGGSDDALPRIVLEGDEVTYYITVTNTTDADAEDVKIYDAIPEAVPANGAKLTVAKNADGSDRISDGGKLRADGSAIDWTIALIPANSTKTVEFTVVVPDVSEDTKWRNIAYVHPHDPDDPDPKDPDPENPEDPWDPTPEVEIEEKYPAVSVVKEQSSERFGRTRDAFSVAGGDVVTYYLTVTNSGEETAEQVVVEDQVPQKTVQGEELPLTLVEGSITEGGQLQSDGITIVWNLGDIGAGVAKTVSFQVRVPYMAGTQYWRNVATTWYENPPTDPENPNTPPAGSKENPTPSNEVEVQKNDPPAPGGNPGGNPGSNPGGNPGGNPGTEIPDNPTPLAEFPDSPVPLSGFETIEDEDVPLAFLAPMTGDNKPVGAAALFGLLALGMMGAFGILGFKKKDEEDA